MSEVKQMTKKDYNDNCKTLLSDSKIDFDMLIQSYALLDKQVSKYAYLKKKFVNCGMSNECNVGEFNIAIQKRNVIEKTIRVNYKLTVDEIKSRIKDVKLLITNVNCQDVIDLINSNSFEIIA